MNPKAIEAHALTADLVQAQLDDLTRVDVEPTEDERAQFVLWAKLQAAMETEQTLDRGCLAVLWRDDTGFHLGVATPAGEWFTEELERGMPPYDIVQTLHLISQIGDNDAI